MLTYKSIRRGRGLAIRSASGMDFFEGETFSYANRGCHQWPKAFFKCDRSIWPLAMLHYLKNALTGAKFGGLSLSPRQRYVRQQSDQADNQGFRKGDSHLFKL